MFKILAALLLVAAPLSVQAAPVPRQGMVCANGPTFNLTASSGYIETPDGNSVLMWSYGAPSFQSPGPVLCVNQGDTVTINLHNALPDPVSIVFPGQSDVGGTGSAGLLAKEAPPGGDATYTFTASQPGTYVYESGTDPSKQVEMGLYGALVVRPAAHPDYAYDVATRFSGEYLILLSDIDPDLHHAVETGGTYDFDTLRNRYFAVNGRQFPDTIQDNGVSWLPNQPYGALVRVKPYNATTNPLPVLIRMINVGTLNHPYHPHGNHLRQIAQDGRKLAVSTEHFAETVASGQTLDYLFSWTDQDSWNSGTNPFPPSVANPDYRNLTFVDGNTWYSGSAYLGAKGTLPTGTASQNVCGEWYFPWHSHALNEFANYDASFGGMATLLRVDPPAGCSSVAGSATVLTGTLRSGNAAALAAADSSYYQVNAAGTSTDWYGGFAAVPKGSANLVTTYAGHNSVSGLATQLSYYRWSSSSWVALGAATAIGTSDVTVTRSVPADAISTQGQVRIRVQTTGPAGFFTSANLLKLTYDAP